MGIGPQILLLLALGGMASPALADEAVTAATADGTVAIDADLRASYLQGQPLLVTLTVRNAGEAATTFPDLSRRHHLVKFQLESQGKKQTRSNKAPATDSGVAWSLPPRSTREVVLQIPSAENLKQGRYTLTLQIDDGQGNTVALGPHKIELIRPAPLRGFAWHDGPTAEKIGHQSVWIQGGSRPGIYIMHSVGANPERKVGTYWIGPATDTTEPMISLAAPTQAWSRYIYWLDGERTLRFVGLEGPGRVGGLHHVDAPWPKVSLVGIGATDPTGGLHVPVWVPAPRGNKGELKIMSWYERSVPRFRSVVGLKQPVDHATTAIDAAGNLRLVIEQEGNVDLYTLDTTKGNQLPATGRRLQAANAEGTGEVLALRLGIMPTHGDVKGGQGLFLLERLTVDGSSVVQGRWLTYAGRSVHTLEPLAVPQGYTIREVLPIGATGVAALLDGPDGKVYVISTGGTARPLGLPGVSPTLLIDTKGRVWARTFVNGSIAKHKLVADGG